MGDLRLSRAAWFECAIDVTATTNKFSGIWWKWKRRNCKNDVTSCERRMDLFLNFHPRFSFLWRLCSFKPVQTASSIWKGSGREIHQENRYILDNCLSAWYVIFIYNITHFPPFHRIQTITIRRGAIITSLLGKRKLKEELKVRKFMIQNTDIGIKDSYLLLITTKKWQGLSKRTDLYLQMNLRRMAFFV